MAEKVKFSSKIGLIAATVGSAIGLGNVWRFPSETQENGGAAFLLIYIVCMLILGIPVMLAEFSLGRAGQSDSVGNIKNLTPKSKWWIAGTFGLIASYMILSYYMVVAGWTFEYLFQSITNGLYDGYTGEDPLFFRNKMGDYISSGYSSVLWTYITIIISFVVLVLGVKKGIERMSNILMPLLFLLLVVFCCTTLTMPNAIEGVKFFLFPDFSKISIDVIINALGQAFFSLSLGMGILVTYAAYYPKQTNLTKTAATVSGLDFVVAFLMGLIIFPAVMSFGGGVDNATLQGTTLVFETLPKIFTSMVGTGFWSISFFLLLTIAAVTSNISIAEVAVSFIMNRFDIKRTKAVCIVLFPIFFTCALSALSLGTIPELSIAGLSVFDFLDTVATNIFLPVSAFSICVYVGWILPNDFIKNELSNYGKIKAPLANVIKFLIKYIAPILIATILVFKIISMI